MQKTKIPRIFAACSKNTPYPLSWPCPHSTSPISQGHSKAQTIPTSSGHTDSFYSLVWFTEGSGSYVIDFEEYEVKPGRIFFVSPKQIHNWEYTENSKGYILVLDTSIGLELQTDFPFPFLDIDSQTAGFLSQVFAAMLEGLEQKADLLVDISYLYRILKRLPQKEGIRHSHTDSILDRYKKNIIENQAEIKTVEAHAEELGLSADALNTLCKQHLGISAKQYLLDLKITEAKRLLLYSRNNINEIAFLLGFEDASYFARLFKKKTQLSPSAFLKKYRKDR